MTIENLSEVKQGLEILEKKVEHNHSILHNIRSNLPGSGLYLMMFISMLASVNSCSYSRNAYHNTQTIEERMVQNYPIKTPEAKTQ